VTEQTKPTLSLSPAEGEDQEVGRWLIALGDTRQRTRQTLKDFPAALIDEPPPSGGSTVGAILYHLAAIEADYLFDDILGTQESDWPAELFPMDVREDGVHLSAFTGETLEEHLSRFEKVRTMLVETISAMTPKELHRPRERKDYDVSPAWVLHHLMQHEAEHRSQIGSVREALGAGLGW
jgi:uncharacterized damage-inducible protein DinB